MSAQVDKSITAAKLGDSLALGELLLAVSPQLERLIRVKLLPHRCPLHDTEDILQEVLRAIVINFTQFRANDARAFRQWIERIAENKVRDSIRRVRAVKRGGQEATMNPRDAAPSKTLGLDEFPCRGESPSTSIKREEIISAIQASVAQLPQAQREAIHYHFLDGQSVLDTAGAMERTPDAVRGLLQRAGYALRRSMGHSSRWFHRS